MLHLESAELTRLVEEKLAVPEIDSTQRGYWLAAGFAVSPSAFEALLATHLEGNSAGLEDVASFFSDRFEQWVARDWLQESGLAFLIRVFAPTCSPDWPKEGHAVSQAMRTADLVRLLVDRLGRFPRAAAETEISKLLEDPSIVAWHRSVRHAMHTQRVSYREATFGRPTFPQVCETLRNNRPANAADLSALVVECIRDLASEIRNGDTDQYKQFWNVDKFARPDSPRPEDACRDSLLARLKDRLRPLGIEAVPEGHYADDKRADIRVSYVMPGLSIAIPIEVKRDSHSDLWTAISDQLIDFYTRAPESKGRGIFLAFWFGGEGMPRSPSGVRPNTAQDLETLLQEVRPHDKRELISICVVDCGRSRTK